MAETLCADAEKNYESTLKMISTWLRTAERELREAVERLAAAE